MSTPFLGQIQLFGFNFPPKGWAICDGSTLPIAQNQALFALLGVQYGGNGTTSFNLPDLRGRCALGFSGTYVQGTAAGEATHTLTTAEMPTHTHAFAVSDTDGVLASPVSAYPAATARTPYVSGVAAGTQLPSSQSGTSQSHSNQSPYLVLNFCIALVGIFPPRS